MAIEFVCPACGGTLRVGDETAGRVIRCGGCMTALRVPAADAETGPSAPPSPYDGGYSHTPSAPAQPEPPVPVAAPTAAPPEPPRAARPVAPPRNRPDPDRPRERRSRRRPPPPPGKGVFFWLVVIGAVLLVGVVGCCGGLYLIMPDAKWQPHESQAGGFKVELPSKPQPDVARMADLKLENGTKAEGTVLLRRGGARFVVVYRDIGPAKQRRKTDEQELDERIERLQNALDAQQLSSKPITVNGFPGREVTIQSRKYGWHAVRVVVADTRLYILLAGGGVALPGDAMVYRFLNSFEITDPDLVREGQRREQQAKLAPKAPRPDGDEKANPWRGKVEIDDEDIGEAAKEVADVALGRAAQEAKIAREARNALKDQEAREARAEEIKLHNAAENVAGVVIRIAAQEAQAARDAVPVAPPVEVAPPPRPIRDVRPVAPPVEVAPPPRSPMANVFESPSVVAPPLEVAPPPRSVDD